MLIVDSTVKSTHLNFNSKPFVAGFLIVSALSIPAALLSHYYSQEPTGSYLSPLPKGELSSTNSPQPTSLPTRGFEENLNLARNFLDKAYTDAKKQNQTESDKKEIINNLNESLRLANNSINLAPTKPEGYLVRAQILTAISKVKPEALAQAKSDLELAQKLSNSANPTLPPVINPLNLIGDEQASLPGNLIIASAEEGNTSSQDSSSGSNASKKIVTLPSGQNELKVNNKDVKESSFIYVVPQKGNNIVSVKSKSTGTFTIQAANPNDIDIPIEYWIIND